MTLSKRNLFILSGVISVLLLILWIVPKWSASEYRNKFRQTTSLLPNREYVLIEKNAADIENSTRLTLAQIFGGFVLLFGLYLTYRQIQVNEEGKITDRFSKAIEHLGDDNLDIRLGGIYALERIAQDSQKDHWTVMEVLTAYVRQHVPYKLETQLVRTEHNLIDAVRGEKKLPQELLREDIQAIMTVISRRKWTETESGILNLTRVNLTWCRVAGGNLHRVWFTGSNLTAAVFYQSNLSGTDFSHANLWQVKFNESNLTGANFGGARNLEIAFFKGSILDRTIFRETEIKLNQLRYAKSFDHAKLSPELEKELKEWQVKQAEEKATVSGDSSEN